MYDISIIGAGPAGLYCAYELIKLNKNLKIAIFEKGNYLENRSCPISNGTTDKCVNCSSCSIMNGFGGAGAFSDGKYNITDEFGGELYKKTKNSIQLMEYVDSINCILGAESIKLYDKYNYNISNKCLENDLHLLNAKIRHLGTELNYKILYNLYEILKTNVDLYCNINIDDITIDENNNNFILYSGIRTYFSNKVIIACGRSGSQWVKSICDNFNINYKSNKVDIGVRVELPYSVFSNITDSLYEGKIVYRTKLYQDFVRTFCMNPNGYVVSENTDGIITVNGHSYNDPKFNSNNTNFALLVSENMTEPFRESTEYGRNIAKLSNMLGDGVIVQRFGDLIRGQRSTKSRIDKSFVKPTLNASPGDLSLVLPKRILDDIIETIYKLDNIAPGTANDDTLLYGVEVKFYNLEVETDNNFQTCINNMYIIGDCSGVTHSLSQAAASGVYLARYICEKII